MQAPTKKLIREIVRNDLHDMTSMPEHKEKLVRFFTEDDYRMLAASVACALADDPRIHVTRKRR